ncbi:MAG TPA: hypothetical protein PL105_02535 [Caldilineaceae bacterium]|nr:hypothetical protein [Caldilineaceae bacterium]
MEYTTLLTHQPGSPWRAVVPGLPDCVAEAPTRAEVLTRIRARIAEQASYTEVLQIEFSVSLQNANGDGAVDALAEIIAMAQPIGPANLARDFDRYTERVLDDNPIQ